MFKYIALSALLLGQITVCHAVTSCVDGTTAKTEWMAGFFQIQTTKGSETYIYNTNAYRFGFNTTASNPVIIRNATENYTINDFNLAGIEINNALGHFFRLEDTFQWAMPPFHNRVIFLEMNAALASGGEWDAVVLPFIVTGSVMEPTITNCFDVGWTGVDEANGDLLGLNFPETGMSAECDAWRGAPDINAALIIFNTNVYGESYGGAAPPADIRQHLIIHEYSHLSGIGHITDTEISCNSVMIRNMDSCPTSLQTRYTCQDIDAIKFMLAD